MCRQVQTKHFTPPALKSGKTTQWNCWGSGCLYSIALLQYLPSCLVRDRSHPSHPNNAVNVGLTSHLLGPIRIFTPLWFQLGSIFFFFFIFFCYFRLTKLIWSYFARQSQLAGKCWLAGLQDSNLLHSEQEEFWHGNKNPSPEFSWLRVAGQKHPWVIDLKYLVAW